MNANYDITTIEETVRSLVRSLDVSENVFCNRPKALPESVSDFVVVRVSGTVADLATFARCTIRIDLFAKDVNSIKNGRKLSVMYQKLVEGVPSIADKIFLTTSPNIIGDTPDDFGFHARMLQFNNSIIKAT